jgi:hypothetical protein
VGGEAALVKRPGQGMTPEGTFVFLERADHPDGRRGRLSLGPAFTFLRKNAPEVSPEADIPSQAGIARVRRGRSGRSGGPQPGRSSESRRVRRQRPIASNSGAWRSSSTSVGTCSASAEAAGGRPRPRPDRCQGCGRPTVVGVFGGVNQQADRTADSIDAATRAAVGQGIPASWRSAHVSPR